MCAESASARRPELAPPRALRSRSRPDARVDRTGLHVYACGVRAGRDVTARIGARILRHIASHTLKSQHMTLTRSDVN